MTLVKISLYCIHNTNVNYNCVGVTVLNFNTIYIAYFFEFSLGMPSLNKFHTTIKFYPCDSLWYTITEKLISAVEFVSILISWFAENYQDYVENCLIFRLLIYLFPSVRFILIILTKFFFGRMIVYSFSV